MGMYTELILKCDVKKEIPDQADAILNMLFNGKELDNDFIMPDHKFFNCPRGQAIGSGNSYYHIPWSNSKYSEGYLFSRSDIKNYDNEINLFIHWITPYLNQVDGDCIGWQWYEEDEIPSLIIFKEVIE